MEFCSNADIEDLYLYCAINIVLLRTLSFNVLTCALKDFLHFQI